MSQKQREYTLDDLVREPAWFIAENARVKATAQALAEAEHKLIGMQAHVDSLKGDFDDLKLSLKSSKLGEAIRQLKEWETVLILYWDQTKPSPSAPEQVLAEINNRFTASEVDWAMGRAHRLGSYGDPMISHRTQIFQEIEERRKK